VGTVASPRKLISIKVIGGGENSEREKTVRATETLLKGKRKKEDSVNKTGLAKEQAETREQRL